MADHQIFQSFKQSFTLQDIDTDVEFVNNFSGMYQNYEVDHSSAFNFHNSLNNFLPHLSMSQGGFENGPRAQPLVSTGDEDRSEKKRKAVELSTPEMSTCSYSSPQVSDSGSRKTKVSFAISNLFSIELCQL